MPKRLGHALFMENTTVINNANGSSSVKGESMSMKLIVPEDGTGFDAAVFTQDGSFVMAGHREACEQTAEEIGGLYCLICGANRVIVRTDFEFKNHVSHMAKTYLDSIYKTVTVYYSQETPPPNFIS